VEAVTRILVTGSRSWRDAPAIGAALFHYIDTNGEWLDGCPALEVTIVHGGCPRGADAMAAAWAEEFSVPQEVHLPDWRRYGRSAGHKRNADMVAAGADVCLAFIRDGSAGATGCARFAETAGIPVRRYTVTSK
jgi:hypothetical protein